MGRASVPGEDRRMGPHRPGRRQSSSGPAVRDPAPGVTQKVRRHGKLTDKRHSAHSPRLHSRSSKWRQPSQPRRCEPEPAGASHSVSVRYRHERYKSIVSNDRPCRGQVAVYEPQRLLRGFTAVQAPDRIDSLRKLSPKCLGFICTEQQVAYRAAI